MNPRKSFSAMLRDLSTDYYNHMLSFEEFRVKRKEILDQVDFHYNEQAAALNAFSDSEDTTQPRKLQVSDTMSFQITDNTDTLPDHKYD